MTLKQFKRGSFRLLRGLGALLLLIILVLIMGGIVSLCAHYPWFNLIWATPVVIGLIWALGGSRE